MNESEAELVDRARCGDAQALTMLLERAGLELGAEIERQIGDRYRNQFDAADILQVTFLEVFLHADTIAPGASGSFRSWLRRIAENNLRDALRALERDKRPSPSRRIEVHDRDRSYLALLEQVAAASNTPSRDCALNELREGVDAALRELPRDYEQVLRLYELEGLSGEEVAERMGRSCGAVRMLLARAREQLVHVLGSDSRFFSSSA